VLSAVQETVSDKARGDQWGKVVVIPCGWGVKAGMVRMWVAGKTV